MTFAQRANENQGKGDGKGRNFGGKGKGHGKGNFGGKGYGKGDSRDRGYSGDRGFGGFSNDRMGGLGQNLKNINWQEESANGLAPFVKNFYQPTPEVASMQPHDVAAWRNQQQMMVVDQHGQDPLNPILTFADAGFPSYIMNSIAKAGYEKPSPIQAQAWPIALRGRDMIGIAQTGSGKTCAFMLPALVHIKAQAPLQWKEGPICLVLAPTRELAMQIKEECDKFCVGSGIRTTCLYGGVPKGPQIRDLNRGAEVVIATPGRLLDLLEMGVTSLKRVTYLCLDEADRMLDMGFEDQVRNICSQIRSDRQTLFFSATWPKSIQHLARDLATEMPVQVTIGNQELKANKSITQYIEVLHERGYALENRKQEFLENILQNIDRSNKVIIFSKTKKDCDRLARQIRYTHHGADAIHGDKSQQDRDWVLQKFRDGRCNILVATDVAARGLDVKDVGCVINYDMPSNIEDYVHRIGRTGRAGARGEAVSFFSSADDAKQAGELIDILNGAEQEIPAELMALRRYGGNKYGNKGGNKYGNGKGKGKGKNNFRGNNYGGKGNNYNSYGRHECAW